MLPDAIVAAIPRAETASSRSRPRMHAAVAAHPEVARLIFENSGDDVFGQAVVFSNRLKASLLVPDQAAAVGAEPQDAVFVLMDGPHLVVGQAVFYGEVGTVLPIEASIHSAQTSWYRDLRRKKSFSDRQVWSSILRS